MGEKTGGHWAGVPHLAQCCCQSVLVFGELLLPFLRLQALLCVLTGGNEQWPFWEQPREV